MIGYPIILNKNLNQKLASNLIVLLVLKGIKLFDYCYTTETNSKSERYWSTKSDKQKRFPFSSVYLIYVGLWCMKVNKKEQSFLDWEKIAIFPNEIFSIVVCNMWMELPSALFALDIEQISFNSQFFLLLNEDWNL